MPRTLHDLAAPPNGRIIVNLVKAGVRKPLRLDEDVVDRIIYFVELSPSMKEEVVVAVGKATRSGRRGQRTRRELARYYPGWTKENFVAFADLLDAAQIDPTLSWLDRGGSPARNNPRKSKPRRKEGVEIYDVREEQVRAQRQAIYESNLLRNLGMSGDFRSPDGLRFDAMLLNEGRASRADLSGYITRYMFQMGTGVPQKHDFLRPGTQTPTLRAIERSYQRYQDVDKLVRNRQDYEESLGIMRKSGFYRVLAEPTRAGIKFTVWPMAPRQAVPKVYGTKREAERVARRLNREADPRATGVWWKPRRKAYTRRELSGWLPPDSAFEGA